MYDKTKLKPSEYQPDDFRNSSWNEKGASTIRSNGSLRSDSI